MSTYASVYQDTRELLRPSKKEINLKVLEKILSSPGLDESSSAPSREDRAHNAAIVLNSIIVLWINTPDKDLDFSDDNFSDIWNATALGSRRVLPHDIECIVTSLYTFGWRNSDWPWVSSSS